MEELVGTSLTQLQMQYQRSQRMRNYFDDGLNISMGHGSMPWIHI